jgi:uncharacterized membrane protein
MEQWVQQIAHHVALAVESVAILVIALGSIEALGRIGAALLTRQKIGEGRVIWMRYAQWLVAALTFQLAADVVSTAVAPDWSEVGRVAAIAAIRTFLAYFLDRDIEQVMQRSEGVKT